MTATSFDLCTPREDVLKGRVKDEEFAADLTAVINGNAPAEYQEPARFFRHTHPTRGLKTLLVNVCCRLGAGGELLRDPALLPPGVERQELDPQTYSLRIPGDPESTRGTSSPQVFYEHFESHQFLWQDAPPFPRLCELAGVIGISDEPSASLRAELGRPG